MSKSLIIAEKPSVAADLARALGGFQKEDDYFESDQYVISSAVGHLVELALPAELDVKRGKWSFANLPIIPDEFRSQTDRENEGALQPAEKADEPRRCRSLINACDAGREGELIFRYLDQLAGNQETDAPALAAIDDGGFDSGSIRTFAFRRGNDSAGQGRGLSIRERLAGRNQRHSRDDRVQQSRPAVFN